MLIKVDTREEQLLATITLLCSTEINRWSNIIVERETLPLGDIIIYNDSNEEILIIERKSLNDFAASIKDGRYAEQSARLSACSLHNHNIIYIIEGDLIKFSGHNKLINQNRSPIDRYTLISAMTSLMYTKGFSVIRTSGLQETGLWILQTAEKILKSKLTSCYAYNNAAIVEAVDYVSLIKRVKKENVTIDNIGNIILCQIPNVSTVLANAVMNKYKNITALINALQNDPTALDDIRLISKNSKIRRPAAQSISNIYNYLLGQNNVLELEKQE